MLTMRSSTAAASQLHARRAIDGQAEKVARLAEIGVPVRVCEEVDESQQVEQENCEEDKEEGTLVSVSATGSILLCFYGGVEPLRFAFFDDIERRRVVLGVYVSAT